MQSTTLVAQRRPSHVKAPDGGSGRLGPRRITIGWLAVGEPCHTHTPSKPVATRIVPGWLHCANGQLLVVIARMEECWWWCVIVDVPPARRTNGSLYGIMAYKYYTVGTYVGVS